MRITTGISPAACRADSYTLNQYSTLSGRSCRSSPSIGGFRFFSERFSAFLILLLLKTPENEGMLEGSEPIPCRLFGRLPGPGAIAVRRAESQVGGLASTKERLERTVADTANLANLLGKRLYAAICQNRHWQNWQDIGKPFVRCQI